MVKMEIITWNYTCCEKGLWVICSYIWERWRRSTVDGYNYCMGSRLYEHVCIPFVDIVRFCTAYFLQNYFFFSALRPSLFVFLFSFIFWLSFTAVYRRSDIYVSHLHECEMCCSTDIVVYGQRISLTWLKFFFSLSAFRSFHVSFGFWHFVSPFFSFFFLIVFLGAKQF